MTPADIRDRDFQSELAGLGHISRRMVGMRINNNISAINAQRRLNANQKAGAKSMKSSQAA